MEVRISVRNLVEFILRSGDIDNRRTVFSDNAMLEGGRIHRMIQKRMGAEYQAEVPLSIVWNAGEYDIFVEGRADGIIEGETDTVDEIKGTYRELGRLKAPVSVHLAQAKCYAYLYGSRKHRELMRVRMTYCNMDTEEIKYFHEEYTMQELEQWFQELMLEYKKWADFEAAWKNQRQQSIRQLSFPFPYREGQKELAGYVYRTINRKRKLFIEAPTGVGKTLSTIFPSIKAVGEAQADKLFYLTAKTITRTVAGDAFELLRQKGLRMKTVILTAKEKICFAEKTECNPVNCPYAKGHYDRINEAVFELLTKTDHFSREAIEEQAQAHQVCPFELCLDMSLFSDAVICDYNYVFDPHVYLKRFFGDGVRGNYIFLIDEAHNLVDRSREMYSAVLRKEAFLALKKTVKDVEHKLAKQLDKCNQELLILKRECETYRIEESIGSFVMALKRVHETMEKFLENNDDGPVREEVLTFYFEVSHFLDIYERVDDNYVTYSEFQENGEFILKLFCVNPTVNLKECMGRGISTILFSATFLPIQYYKNLLGGEPEDYEVYAQPIFDPKRRALYIGSDVTTRYTRRSDMEYYNIAAYIYEIVKNRHGNYLVFFPSHVFLRRIHEIFEQYFGGGEIECLIQSDHMSEEEREGFLNRFSGNEDCNLEELIQMEIELEEEKSLIGFCVMGGIFSEGIDLKNDSLIGAIVVGTGLPQVCNEREILKGYFEEQGEDGFDFAYRYPGMNKVLQAAGRVIRTAEDVGIIALLDDRFLQNSYKRMFPREWDSVEIVTRNQIAKKVERFWDEWL